MTIEHILKEYDAMFGRRSLEEIEQFLIEQMEEAKEAEIRFTLLNEIIGFCRDTTQKEKALHYCDRLQELMKQMKIEGSIEYATANLNIANAYRAFDMAREAISIFEEVHESYQSRLKPYDFRYASLYNNWSLAYQELADYEKAKELLFQALTIVDSYEDARIPQATTRTNLAASLFQMGTEYSYSEGMKYLTEALEIFEKDGGGDFHYGAALVAMGDAYSYKKEFDQALHFYERGMQEIEKHVGKTENYMRILEKYHDAREKSQGKVWKSNLEKSKQFYEEYGRKMIHTYFPEYEERIAVGMAGEGSDCYGFDDDISKDHDYEVGFCMWLLESDYKEIGDRLQKEYENLIREHGIGQRGNSHLQNRRGVCSINQFYNHLLGTNQNYEIGIKIDFENVEEYQLAAVTNGWIFRDDAGVFTAVRGEIQSYYPEVIWRKKLAQGFHDFSQFAQSNYSRMMARGDSITAQICVAKAVESTMNLLYLLQHTYAPYYKWKKKGLEKVPFAQPILSLLEEIAKLPEQSQAWKDEQYDAQVLNTKDSCVVLFEEIAKQILDELEKQGYIRVSDTFLESYIPQILKGKNMDLVEKIIELEWNQFDQVKNIGGRADCQDDFETFSIMRKSQYLTWTEELLVSYCNDLIAADRRGWNLIMEKYARMMQSTNPKEYAEFEPDLPLLHEERIRIQEEVIKIQVEWMEEAAKKYPRITKNMRSIRTNTDTPFNTSYETYLRGELGTYSEQTFILYTGFVISLMKKGANLAINTIKNTVECYGYASIEEAEKQ